MPKHIQHGPRQEYLRCIEIRRDPQPIDQMLLSQARRVAILGILLLLIFGIGGELYQQERGHPHLSGAYLYGGLICCAYAFYAVHIGMLNGEERIQT